MAKEKVYKLAQEFKVSSEALVQMLRGMGIVVKSHMSTVDENLRDEIKRRFEQERAEIKKVYERKKQIITKAREDLVGKPEETAPAQPQPSDTSAPTTTDAVTTSAPVVTAVSGDPAPAAPVQPPEVKRTIHVPAAHRPTGSGYQSSQPSRPAASGAPGAPNASSAAPQRRFAGVGRSRPNDRFYTDRIVEKSSVAAPVMPPVESKNFTHDSAAKKKKPHGKKKHEKKPEVDELELKANVKRTLAQIGSGFEKKKYSKKERTLQDDGDTEGKNILHVSEFVTASELANMMHKSVSEVLAKCLELGLFVTINQRLDFDTIAVIVDEFGFDAKLLDEYTPEDEDEKEEVNEADLRPRPPVVTIMGHVDHGKTSLLDYIRKTNVIAGEAGGITQHIAAYEVHTQRGPVTFLDTPGHEAFTAMRARGSQITDVIVLIVAADNGVMPQTKEAIDHARAANVPLVIAINKVDLAVANVDKVKAELAQYNVLVDSYGGQISCVEISARTGKNVDKLLETLALETEILDLKANPNGLMSGVVVESELDKGRGPIATVLIQKGTLKRGDAFVTGIHSGRVRDLLNERGKSMESAGPGQPVIVLGMSGTPQAGDSFKVVADEKDAREISARRRLAQRDREIRKIGTASLDNLYEQIQAGKVQNLNLVIKGDVDGSVEALAASLEKLSTPEIKVRVIHKSVGAVKETDVMLAAASNALVLGFHLNPNTKIRELAKSEGVDIRTYRIIYEAVDAVKMALEGMLAPEIRETILAQIEVRKVFKISKLGNVAGCFITMGTVTRGAKARLIRDDVEIADTRILTLHRASEAVKELPSGGECGVGLERVTDFKEGDRIETYMETTIARKLS